MLFCSLAQRARLAGVSRHGMDMVGRLGWGARVEGGSRLSLSLGSSGSFCSRAPLMCLHVPVNRLPVNRALDNRASGWAAGKWGCSVALEDQQARSWVRTQTVPLALTHGAAASENGRLCLGLCAGFGPRGVRFQTRVPAAAHFQWQHVLRKTQHMHRHGFLSHVP